MYYSAGITPFTCPSTTPVCGTWEISLKEGLKQTFPCNLLPANRFARMSNQSSAVPSSRQLLVGSRRVSESSTTFQNITQMPCATRFSPCHQRVCSAATWNCRAVSCRCLRDCLYIDCLLRCGCSRTTFVPPQVAPMLYLGRLKNLSPLPSRLT